VVQLRKYKEQPVQEAEARKLAHSLGNIFVFLITIIFFQNLAASVPDPNPYPDPLVRGMDPRIRIHTKMS
jgi:hypothetical protein